MERDLMVQTLAALDADEFRQVLAEALGAQPAPADPASAAQTKAAQAFRAAVTGGGATS